MSPDTARWCARKRYPYVALATYPEPTAELWTYAEKAAKEGYQAGSENLGYLQPLFVSDDQKRAEELGKRYLFGGHFAHFARGEWMFPSRAPDASSRWPGRSGSRRRDRIQVRSDHRPAAAS